MTEPRGLVEGRPAGSRATAGAGTLAAVLFDMDGTLVDSEKVWSIGLTELAARHGAVLSMPARRAMVGTSMAESMIILHADIDRPDLDVPASVHWLEDRVKELFAEGLTWRPGASELLAAVRAAGLGTALVTATRRRLVEVALGTIGAERFDAVVCGDDVPQTKPHPMPYLTAAALVGVPVDRCVAIEDSPNGVRSALAAGCAVLAIPCEVPLPAAEGVTIMESLVGVDVDVLRALLRPAPPGRRGAGS